jgi:hypothetical protein
MDQMDKVHILQVDKVKIKKLKTTTWSTDEMQNDLKYTHYCADNKLFCFKGTVSRDGGWDEAKE